MKKNYLLVILLVLIIGGFATYELTKPVQSPNLVPENTSSTPLVNSIKNNTYLIEGQEVSLVNGREERLVSEETSSKQITTYFGNEVVADFNNDGLSDTAFLLTQESSGSGTFFYVTAALGASDGYSGLNAIFLGDRIAPQSTEYRDGEIIVNYLERATDDSFATDPSVGVSKYFKVVDDKLAEIVK